MYQCFDEVQDASMFDGLGNVPLFWWGYDVRIIAFKYVRGFVLVLMG